MSIVRLICVACVAVIPFCAMAEWEIEIVDSTGDVGMFCSLALNSLGYECISYQDVDHRDLKYAHQAGSGWSFEDPDTIGSTGWDTSLAITANDVPCISYWDYQNNVLRYAEWSTVWNLETVPGTTGAGCFTSICVSPAGRPHISYIDYTHGYTQYATRQPGGWDLITIDSASGTQGAPTSIAWDNAGFSRMSYLRSGTGLMHAFDVKPPASCNHEKIDQAPGAGRVSSMAINAGGYSCIAYIIEGSPNTVWYAEDSPGGWTYQNVYNGPENVWDCSLALRDSVYPCIAYNLDTSGSLVFAVREGSSWHSNTVLQASVRPEHLSLAVGADGRAHIAYYDLVNLDLVVAREIPPPPLGVRLSMPGHYFTPGSHCHLLATLHNTGTPLQNVPLVVLLDVYGNYWFWPGWGNSSFDYQMVTVPAPLSEQFIIPDFVWPATGPSTALNLVFYGALLDSAMSSILGGNDGLGSWTFGYGP